MISAQVLADSLAPCGKRLTTYLLYYPRFIHSELMTHRQLSRNSSSSRAIPVSRVLREVWQNPAEPVFWGRNGKGMQAGENLPRNGQFWCRLVWWLASRVACGFSWLLSKLGAHKQLANRLTEPFAHITTIVSGTEWENFFALRVHPAVQPEFQALAVEMLKLYLGSVPKRLEAGQWHLPFMDQDKSDMAVRDATDGKSASHLQWILKRAVAKCARVSYKNFDGEESSEQDYDLHDRLAAEGHWSPFEHVARAEDYQVRSGNFIGFTQYRKMFVGETRHLTPKEIQGLLSEGKTRG